MQQSVGRCKLVVARPRGQCVVVVLSVTQTSLPPHESLVSSLIMCCRIAYLPSRQALQHCLVQPSVVSTRRAKMYANDYPVSIHSVILTTVNYGYMYVHIMVTFWASSEDST